MEQWRSLPKTTSSVNTWTDRINLLFTVTQPLTHHRPGTVWHKCVWTFTKVCDSHRQRLLFLQWLSKDLSSLLVGEPASTSSKSFLERNYLFIWLFRYADFKSATGYHKVSVLHLYQLLYESLCIHSAHLLNILSTSAILEAHIM